MTVQMSAALVITDLFMRLIRCRSERLFKLPKFRQPSMPDFAELYHKSLSSVQHDCLAHVLQAVKRRHLLIDYRGIRRRLPELWLIANLSPIHHRAYQCRRRLRIHP